MTIHLHQQERMVQGYAVLVDLQLGHLMVAHDGRITWDDLQAIKDEVWGKEARAIEVYPRSGDVVNAGNFRHLWRLGEGDFCPDLLIHRESDVFHADNLEIRHNIAWLDADEVFA